MYRFPGIWYWTALVLLLAGAWVYVDRRDLTRHFETARDSHSQAEALRQELHTSAESVRRLEARVEHLQGDPVEMEAVARHNKNLVREGETIFRVVLPEERVAE